MITEAMQWIAAQVTKAQSPQLLRVDDIPNKVWVAHGGTLHTQDTEPPPLRLLVHSLGSLVAVVKNQVFDSAGVHIYVSGDSISVVDQSLDRRRGWCMLQLEQSIPLLRLVQIDGQSLSHAQFMRDFRTVFDRCAPAGFAGRFAKLDFKRRNDGTRTIEHGRESLGKSIEAAVAGADELPNEVTLQLPLFATDGLRDLYDVECRILIDADNEERPLSIHVRPDAITHLVSKQLRDTATSLAEILDTDHVYVGRYGSELE